MDNYLPQQFTNELFGSIRVLDINNEPWFVATDIAKALGYADATHLTRNIIDPRDKGLQKVETLGGSQDLSVINESGLYSAIFSSRLPAAIEFKHWVTSEVLPTMRQLGFNNSLQILQNEVYKLRELNNTLFSANQFASSKALSDTVKNVGQERIIYNFITNSNISTSDKLWALNFDPSTVNPYVDYKEAINTFIHQNIIDNEGV